MPVPGTKPSPDNVADGMKGIFRSEEGNLRKGLIGFLLTVLVLVLFEVGGTWASLHPHQLDVDRPMSVQLLRRLGVVLGIFSAVLWPVSVYFLVASAVEAFARLRGRSAKKALRA